VLEFLTGDTRLVVYVSEFAGSNKANAVVWNGAGDFDAIVDQLRDQGVTFEEYPDLGMEIERGVHGRGGFKAVWFMDPDGNLLHVTNM
jgi:catechol 2,3-dioxygenase-like lactoylglutathione lyase family enzyme